MQKLPRNLSGSLAGHAANASKSRPHNVFGSNSNPTPKLKKDTFVGSGSDSSSSDSDSESDFDTKRPSALDFAKTVSTPSSRPNMNGATSAKHGLKTSRTATPAKTSTVNGVAASMASKKEKGLNTGIKKEDTTSSSESSSDSESEDESDDAVSPKKKESTKNTSKAKSPVKKNASSDTSSSAGSESESGSDREEISEDPSQQIAAQLRNDLKSVKSQSSKAQSSKAQPASEELSRKKKAKRAEPPVRDEDGDVDMIDGSMALTNGGNPTNVGDVPEFVAPDFHLRKLEEQSKPADIANFFSKAHLEGKQVWYITAPASVPVTVVQDLSIPMDKAQQGLPVLTHNGDDYRLAFENPTASSSFRLLIPSQKGDEFSPLERAVDQTMHFTRSETFPPEGPSSVITTQTISTSRAGRPQPEGLRARYTPLGVPAPKASFAPVNKVAQSAAAEDAASTLSKGSSKKKRKHRDDGEDESVSTPAITIPVSATTKASSSNKMPSAEKFAKKQKISRDGTPRKETPVPLPQLGSKSHSMNFATQPLPRTRLSMSPGVALPGKQVPISSKYAHYTPVPAPILPVPSSSATSRPLISSHAMTKDLEKQAKRAEKERNKAEKEAEKQHKRAEKDAARLRKSPGKQTQIPPPRFDGRGVPIY